ncbi:S-adenosyl-L-methionine-dependent methyltransferase [Pseudovirgaria hyperparasitica]|uniref:S-adenosyl-L-methionine-dependent methyltransferase n=1 Tax=Pseudovirgaria hyperparasitica TaxID=470096 RepID=A0A6A6W1R3_9PEZI|nr:S-adenosyl-L-methionine-dependent methyltransferase [Pseudovirgaria hyperparasitica]KAF2756016.1 S-adenosyl-L-methionine-dependent methyltransferase [Pseudovirgaria hyperparasitica]
MHLSDRHLAWLTATASTEALLDSGVLPHAVIRLGIRTQLRQRIQLISSTSLESSWVTKMKYVDLLRTRPIAIETKTANEQHYEVGTGVLAACLGPRMKYSCCLYEDDGRGGIKGSLAEAEDRMLDLYVQRAGVVDGMSVLDLGCGWGSLSLYLAARFPKSPITGFSNSATQKTYIDARAAALGLKNLTIVTGDVVEHTFEAAAYDRVISIELFEHMKNYELLMAKVSHALVPSGKLFLHIFHHANTPYDFEDGWMTTHFFTGGTMPSADLMHFFQRDLTLTRQWYVNGKHYARTCEDWLSKMCASKKEIWPHLVETYGADKASVWWVRWQVFYMACAELFAWDGGEVWGVGHYLFEKRQ